MAVTFTQRGAAINISAVNLPQLVREIKLASSVDAVVGPGDGTLTRNGILVISDNITSGKDVTLFEVDNSEAPDSEHAEDFVFQDWTDPAQIDEIRTAITNHVATTLLVPFAARVFLDNVDPGVTDDDDKGVDLRDFWFNSNEVKFFVNKDNATGAADWKNLSQRTFRVGWTQAETASGTHHVAGVFEQEAVAETVDSVTSPVISDIGRQHLMLDVSAITTPGTLRIVGTSYDEDDGTTTGADTEDIVIGSGLTGFYRSTKDWQGDVTLFSVSSLDCVVDAYRYDSFGHHLLVPSSTLEHIVWSAKAIVPAHSAQIQLFKFDPVARTMVTFYDETQSSATGKTFGDSRHWVTGATSIDFDNDEGLYVRMITTATEDLGFELGFKRF